MPILEFFTTIKVPMTVLHVLSVVFGMGAALMSDLLFNFYSRDKKLSSKEIATLKLLSNAVWVGLIVIILSGIGLFLSDITKYAHSVKFFAKMSVLSILIINGYVLHKYVWRHVISRGFFTSSKETPMRRLAFACGAISVLSWITVCSLGVLDRIGIGYEVFMTGYVVAVAGSILVALFVEHRQFER